MSTDANGTRTGTYAAVNGLRIYYEIHGSGRPLVLLHGGVLTLDRTFGPLLPALAKTTRSSALNYKDTGTPQTPGAR